MTKLNIIKLIGIFIILIFAFPATSEAYRKHKAHIAIPKPILSIESAKEAIHKEAIEHWTEPEVEASVFDCHYINSNNNEVVCSINWSDPKWVSPTCGATVIGGQDEAILEDKIIKVYVYAKKS